MIFVTVGMHPRGFERLVRAADDVASVVEEPVVVQRGGTQYAPKFAQYFDYVDENELQMWLSQARVVVSHAGAGSIINALQADKPLVVVPRQTRFGEVLDDHQMELAEVLAQQGRATTVIDLSTETLLTAIARATQLTGQASPPGGLQQALRAWLAEQAERPTRGRQGLFRWSRRGG
jgi:beta-1,4-N-acetylglucosaminyltransferase